MFEVCQGGQMPFRKINVDGVATVAGVLPRYDRR